jgi:uncharacterized protein
MTPTVSQPTQERSQRLVSLPCVKTPQAGAPEIYKPSRFNAHTRANDGKLLLYNSYTGHSCAIPEKHADEASAYLNAGGHSGPLSKVGEYLRAKGYIVDSQIDEDARWDIRYGQQQYRTDKLELTLLSSEDCNFRCVYCSQEFKRGSMAAPVREGVRHLLQSRIERLKSLSVSWFGGEPLLGYDAIEELAPYFHAAAASHGLAFQSSMTTNAYLLTEDRARKLLSWGVDSYQITLDGLAADHDTHRPLESGEKTFEVILQNLIAMKGMQENFEVAIRCNFDRTNIDSIQRLVEALKSLAGGDPRFSVRFRPIGKWGGPKDDQLDVCGVHEASRQFIQLTTTAMKAGLKTEQQGSSEPCYAARPYSLVIGADGKVMKCTVALDTDERNVVGRLAADGTIDMNEERFSLWTRPYYRRDPMCNSCFFVPVCQGVICPLPRITLNDRACPSEKIEIQQTLKDRYHMAQVSQAAAGHARFSEA